MRHFLLDIIIIIRLASARTSYLCQAWSPFQSSNNQHTHDLLGARNVVTSSIKIIFVVLKSTTCRLPLWSWHSAAATETSWELESCTYCTLCLTWSKLKLKLNHCSFCCFNLFTFSIVLVQVESVAIHTVIYPAWKARLLLTEYSTTHSVSRLSFAICAYYSLPYNCSRTTNEWTIDDCTH